MAKFRKKPVAIEAEQYTEYGKLVKGMCNSQSCFVAGTNKPHVHTIHDNQIVNLEIGDWIIPEPDGKHYYPVKSEIFTETYEQVIEDVVGGPMCGTYKQDPCECIKTDCGTPHHEREAFKEKIANVIFSRKPLYEKIDIAREILEELDMVTR